MNHLEEFLKMCYKVIAMSDDEKARVNMPDVGMEGLKVRPMIVKESDDPCVYDIATGEFVFVNKGESE